MKFNEYRCALRVSSRNLVLGGGGGGGPPVKVCACCVYCHDEVVHQCSMLSAGPPHGT